MSSLMKVLFLFAIGYSNRYQLLGFVVGTTIYPTIASAQQEVLTQTSDEREPLRYLFYSPPCNELDDQQSFPLVLFLHGGGEASVSISLSRTHA